MHRDGRLKRDYEKESELLRSSESELWNLAEGAMNDSSTKIADENWQPVTIDEIDEKNARSTEHKAAPSPDSPYEFGRNAVATGGDSFAIRSDDSRTRLSCNSTGSEPKLRAITSRVECEIWREREKLKFRLNSCTQRWCPVNEPNARLQEAVNVFSKNIFTLQSAISARRGLGRLYTQRGCAAHSSAQRGEKERRREAYMPDNSVAHTAVLWETLAGSCVRHSRG